MCNVMPLQCNVSQTIMQLRSSLWDVWHFPPLGVHNSLSYTNRISCPSRVCSRRGCCDLIWWFRKHREPRFRNHERFHSEADGFCGWGGCTGENEVSMKTDGADWLVHRYTGVCIYTNTPVYLACAHLYTGVAQHLRGDIHTTRVVLPAHPHGYLKLWLSGNPLFSIGFLPPPHKWEGFLVTHSRNTAPYNPIHQFSIHGTLVFRKWSAGVP